MHHSWTRFFFLGLVLLCSTIFLHGCDTRISKPAPVTQGGSFVKDRGTALLKESTGPQHKIALLLPLSGPQEDLGRSLQQAAELSLFENADDNLELIIQDTQGTPTGAKVAALKATQSGARLILGPLFSSNVREVTPFSTRHKINVLSFSNNTSVAGNGVFVLGFSPVDQVRRISKFARAQGLTPLASYVPTSAYGNLIKNELAGLNARGEIILTSIYPYTPGDLSHLPKPQDPEMVRGLMIPEGGHQLTRLISALLYHEVDLENYKLLGTGQWDTPETLANQSLQGAWFAASDPKERKEFEARFYNLYGKMPPRIATLAYDAVSLAATLAKANARNPFTFASLTQRRGFAGIDGVFRLNPTGVTERCLAILEVTPLGFKVIDPAPCHF